MQNGDFHSISPPSSLWPESETQLDGEERPRTVFLNETAPLYWANSLDFSGLDDTWVASKFDDDSLSIHDEDVALPSSEVASDAETRDGDVLGVGVRDQPKLGEVTVGLPFSTLTQPRSLFQGFIPPAPEDKEGHAVATLLESAGAPSPDDTHIEFDLYNFSIYMDTPAYPDELRPLQHFATKLHGPCMYFDGVLRRGDIEFFLRKIPFRKLPVGNYDVGEHTVGDQIWIHSALNEKLKREIYYKLGSPAPEYRRFHLPFLWIADLAKHVIDYCEHLRDKGRRAVLYDFKSRFSIWVLQKHRSSAVFQKWHLGNRSADFRGAIVANVDYLWKEAHGLDPQITSWHTIWKEVKTCDRYKPNLIKFHISSTKSSKRQFLEETPEARKDNTVSKTIVTPYVHDLFAHMVFGQLLESKEPSMPVEKRLAEFVRKTDMMSVQPSCSRTTKRRATDQNALIQSIRRGDVISTKPDDDTTDTGWKNEPSKHYQGEHLWFGLVQQVHTRPNGKRSFDVLWLYQPIDTPCSVMKYPWANELFLSDNCTCHHDTAKIQGHEILSTHEIEWFGNSSTSAEFFVRQTYVASSCRWTSLKREHLVCGDESAYSQDSQNQYRIGDAVLVETQVERLEAFIIEYFFDEGNTRFARMRRLRRRKDVDRHAHLSPPNELVYSQQSVKIATKMIHRRCLVRAFHVDEKLSPPYDRNGTGDAFFITHEEVEINGSMRYQPLQSPHHELFRQGFDPSQNSKIQKLQGLDLFCGGGNFGRGLEDGGAVEMRWANDIWNGAIHTYMANTKPDSCTPFLGSIDDLLGLALEGDKQVPTPGDVHFISAGSPCPGFSLLTKDKTTGPQRKNQSLVASFASYVDLYRPLYGILENVPTMVNSSGFRHSCVFSQLVCAIVGLGYQVQVLFLDAWSFGASQSRTRVFLCFTAPGLRTPNPPKPSHSHPENIPLTKLGVMSCGRPFDSRKRVPTPFEFVSMRDAVGDLPDIQDAKADYCIGYPDHRLSMGYTPVLRKQLQQIPTHPYGMNFSKSWWGRSDFPPVMTVTERLLFPEDGSERTKRHSNGWGRVDPTNLLGTIPTTCSPTDARTGRVSHWEQNRPMTIMEARRAQGFLDHEVLIGVPSDQYRIIGNSVSRHVALVLGLAIREAWLGTLFDEASAELSLPIKSQSDANITIQSVEMEEVDMEVRTESHASSDEISGERSEDCFTMLTPCSVGVFTPASSESAEPFDRAMSRKRSLPLFVEIMAKKRRHSFDPNECLRAE
ncbi:S-adenosyl-L-methionine-dependent methyltransferase [Xylariaceae sp. FL1651]|nr:S-adenosyl-L-methionine-dependent methyltransferase [Xylariaceae sp. FL1651]